MIAKNIFGKLEIEQSSFTIAYKFRNSLDENKDHQRGLFLIRLKY